MSLIILMISDRILINFNYDGYYLSLNRKKYHLIFILYYMCISYFFLKIIILINFVIANDLGICKLLLLMAT